MIIQVPTVKFNPNELGRPWIAIVDFSKEDYREQYAWGRWTGNFRIGSAGILTVNAEPGNIIATGQKEKVEQNYRTGRRRHYQGGVAYYEPSRLIEPKTPDFFVVLVNGHKRSLGKRADAFTYYLNEQEGKKDSDALLAERILLVARIGEIDRIIGGGGHRLTKKLDG